MPLLLALLALLDLRVELQLLADYFTLASLAAAIRNHLLATAVLFLLPSLLHHYCITTAKGHSKNSSDYFN